MINRKLHEPHSVCHAILRLRVVCFVMACSLAPLSQLPSSLPPSLPPFLPSSLPPFLPPFLPPLFLPPFFPPFLPPFLPPSLPPSLLRPGNELIYGFSEFACTLNEMEEGVAPTDSRLRPDQRIMEQGDFDLANKEKVSECGAN